MGIERGWYLRPLEWTDSLGGFSIAGTAETIDEGVYANVLVLARQITKQSGSNYQVRIVDVANEPRIYVYHASNTVFAMDFTGSIFGGALGFTSLSYTGASYYQAEHTPLASWYPGYCRSDQSHWAIDLEDAQVGSEARSGADAWSRFSASVYKNEHNYEAIPDYLVYKAASRNIFDTNACIEQFTDDCRITWPSVATYPSPSGCWYIPDYTSLPVDANGRYYVATGVTGGNEGWLVDREGVQYFLTSSPDLVTFCRLSADWYPQGSAWLPHTRARYRVSVSVHTSPIPTGYQTSVVPS